MIHAGAPEYEPIDRTAVTQNSKQSFEMHIYTIVTYNACIPQLCHILLLCCVECMGFLYVAAGVYAVLAPRGGHQDSTNSEGTRTSNDEADQAYEILTRN